MPHLSDKTMSWLEYFLKDISYTCNIAPPVPITTISNLCLSVTVCEDGRSLYSKLR